MASIIGILAGVTIVAVSAVVIGRGIFDRRISTEIDELFARSKNARPTALTEADLAGLPEPVRRWLQYSQVLGKERPATVRLKQQGQFRLGEAQGWMPFTAEECYTTDPRLHLGSDVQNGSRAVYRRPGPVHRWYGQH